VHLANFPDRDAGFGAAGLTSWGVTIRTGGAQQVGDAAVAGRVPGGGKLGALHSSSPGIMMINARNRRAHDVVARSLRDRLGKCCH
jgi:hypothetical protein